MSMRSQVYEWSNLATATAASTLRRTTDAVPQLVPINREYDIFIGGIGNNITKPAETTAYAVYRPSKTSLVLLTTAVLSKFVSIQLTTSKTPMSQTKVVFRGLASPYPRGSGDQPVVDATTDYTQLLKSFDPLPRCLCASGTGFPNSLLLHNCTYRCGGYKHSRCCGIREIYLV